MLSTTNDPLKDKELSGKLKCHERDITKLLRKGKDVLFRLSHELFLARNTCLEHNSETAFGQWVEGLGISRSGAYRSIARWEVLAPKILGHPASGVGCHAAGSQPSFEGFLCFAKFDDSALDVLAKHSTPPKAINAAVKTAQAGKGMTKKEAVALVEKHTKPKPEPVDEPDDVGCIPAMAMDPATVLQDPIDVDSQPATPAEVQEAVAQAAADDAKPEDFGKCPNCAGAKWIETDDGTCCKKCNHPHGEPAGDADDDRMNTQRQKTVKTLEAAMRAFDDLQTMKARPEHGEAIEGCKGLIQTAQEWK
jgi:hypothetical protein